MRNQQMCAWKAGTFRHHRGKSWSTRSSSISGSKAFF